MRHPPSDAASFLFTHSLSHPAPPLSDHGVDQPPMFHPTAQESSPTAHAAIIGSHQSPTPQPWMFQYVPSCVPIVSVMFGCFIFMIRTIFIHWRSHAPHSLCFSIFHMLLGLVMGCFTSPLMYPFVATFRSSVHCQYHVTRLSHMYIYGKTAPGRDPLNFDISGCPLPV